MSPLGPIAYGENQDTVFLGRDITRHESFSQDTARLIDDEVKKIINEQYERATKILMERRAALDAIAAGLLEHETLEGKHIMEILEHGEIRSVVHSSLPPPIEPEEKPKGGSKVGKPSAETDMGGAGSPAPSPA